jgi:ATP-dependent RNA helicase RhlE
MNTDATPQTTHTFYGLGLAPTFLDLLEKRNFKAPTPIQHKAIPIAVEGKDVIGIAQTGTGKTLSFGLPMLQRLQQGKGRGLVIVPTRELAYQVEESLLQFAPAVGIKTAVFVGGASMNIQRQMLRQNPRVLIATPGRLLDHLQQGTVTLKEVSILVLDEADRMLDMGFAPQINKILPHIPKERQTMLFSATMPADIVKLATHQMKLPLRIEVAPQGTASERVSQEMFVIQKNEKIRLLEKLLDEYKGTVLVFSRTKHGAKKITQSVRNMGHAAAEIHANRSLAQRREALEGFKKGKYRVLVATDIAARGIDVTGIELVINFDLPDNPEDYVHRIGRTGRAGLEGRAISFATPEQNGGIRDIERLMRSPIPRSRTPELPAARAPVPNQTQEPEREERQFRGGNHRQSFGGHRRRFRR